MEGCALGALKKKKSKLINLDSRDSRPKTSIGAIPGDSSWNMHTHASLVMRSLNRKLAVLELARGGLAIL